MASRTNDSAESLSFEITVSYATIMGLILLGAILGNILVLIAVYISPTLRTTSAILVVNLACVDLLISVAIVPFVAITAIAQEWTLSEEACVVTGFINSFLTAAQIMALFHISVNRFVAVARPHSYETNFFKRASVVMVFAGWLHSIIWTSLPFWGWGQLGFVKGTLFCNILWEQEQSYALTVQIICYLVPPPIAAVLYCLVYIKVREHSRRLLVSRNSNTSNVFYMKTTGTSESREDIFNSEQSARTKSASDLSRVSVPKSKRRKSMESRVTKTLLSVALTFVICWSPRGVANMWALFEGREAVPRALEYASTTFVFLNSAVNPLLYAALHRDFNKAFRRILCCSKQELPRHSRTDDRSGAGL